MYREIIAVCSELHTKHANTMCWQKLNFRILKLVVHKATPNEEDGPSMNNQWYRTSGRDRTAGLSPRKIWFDPWPVHMRFVVDTVALA